MKRKVVVRVRVKRKSKCQHEVVNWATSNCRTSMVQTIVYSGCTETTVPCSPYCTCIRYGSNDRKKNSDHHIHHGESQTTRRRQQSTRTTSQQCSNSQETRGSETVVEREAEGERKEEKEVWGRKWWSMLSSQKKTNVTPRSNRRTSMVQTIVYSRCT